MGLYKRGKAWWMTFAFEGRQVRRSTGTSDRRLAEAILAKVKVKIVEGRYFDTLEAKEHTFEELMERYMAVKGAQKASKVSCKGYLTNLRPFFGHMTLAAITPSRIVEYKEKRYEDGVKPATINRELALMKHAFNVAMREWEWCRENPVCRVSMEKENNRRDRWLADPEETRLLKHAPPWLKEIVTFALHTGMRRGEILALTWDGVDFARNTVTVFRSKNGEPRTLPINQTVQTLLKRRAKVRPLQTNCVFSSSAHTPIDGANLRRAFNSAMEKAKIEDFRFHDLRHTFATRLVQAGVDIYKVQRLLGHKSPMMTQRYAHHCPDSLRDGVDILDRKEANITKTSQSRVRANGARLQVIEKMVRPEGFDHATER